MNLLVTVAYFKQQVMESIQGEKQQRHFLYNVYLTLHPEAASRGCHGVS